MSETRIVWLDLETGGTDEDMDQITQIAAVATLDPPDFKEIDSFERKIQLVNGHYNDEALKIQGYSEERWKDAIPTQQALGEFVDWIKPHCHTRKSKRTGRDYQVAHMAGFNAVFDGRFLRATCERNKVWMPLTNWTGGIFDVMHLAKWEYLKTGDYLETFTLSSLCELIGIKLDAHDAKNDVLATIQLARDFM